MHRIFQYAGARGRIAASDASHAESHCSGHVSSFVNAAQHLSLARRGSVSGDPFQVSPHLDHRQQPEIDCSGVVSLVHSLSHLGISGALVAGAVGAAARALLPNLDVLSLEDLVAAAWAFSASLVLLQRSEASDVSVSDRPSPTTTAAPIHCLTPLLSASSAVAPLQASAHPKRIDGNKDGSFDRQSNQRAIEELLRGLSAMLREAIPAGGRPEQILQGLELHHLRQAHAFCCFLAAPDRRDDRGQAAGPSKTASRNGARMLLDIRPDIIQAGASQRPSRTMIVSLKRKETDDPFFLHIIFSHIHF